MKKENTISIIVPVYNVEQYLPRCVDSLVNQTYQNLEIILVDDGSPDRCGEICDEYAEQDSRVRVIHKANGGLSDARNAGLDAATGDYVMFIDSDDWIELETCEVAIHLMTENKVGIVTFGVKNVYDSGRIIEYSPKLCGVVSSSECIKALLFRIQYYGIFNYACNKLYSARLFSSLRFLQGRLAEDQGLVYRLFHEAGKIYVCSQCFYNYYQRVGSITSNQFSPKLVCDRHFLWMERLAFIKEFYPSLEKLQVALILGAVYVSLITLKGNDEYRDLWKTMQIFAKEHCREEKELAKYSKKVRLHYYCYPLFWLYVKLFIK